MHGAALALQVAKGQLSRFPVCRVHAAQPLIDRQRWRNAQALGQRRVQVQLRLIQTPLPPASPQLQLQAVQALALLIQLMRSQTTE
ncbi:hypothetical protein D3C76_1440270 [compost metagenome]